MKRVTVLLVLGMTILLSSCGQKGVSQESYDSLSAEKHTLEYRLNSANDQLESLSAELEETVEALKT